MKTAILYRPVIVQWRALVDRVSEAEQKSVSPGFLSVRSTPSRREGFAKILGLKIDVEIGIH